VIVIYDDAKRTTLFSFSPLRRRSIVVVHWILTPKVLGSILSVSCVFLVFAHHFAIYCHRETNAPRTNKYHKSKQNTTTLHVIPDSLKPLFDCSIVGDVTLPAFRPTFELQTSSAFASFEANRRVGGRHNDLTIVTLEPKESANQRYLRCDLLDAYVFCTVFCNVDFLRHLG
jgi:hypothetical protein